MPPMKVWLSGAWKEKGVGLHRPGSPSSSPGHRREGWGDSGVLMPGPPVESRGGEASFHYQRMWGYFMNTCVIQECICKLEG